MKIKLIGGIAAIVVATVVAFNVNLSARNNGLSDISLANVEALAVSENSDCPNGCHLYGPYCYCYRDYVGYLEHQW